MRKYACYAPERWPCEGQPVAVAWPSLQRPSSHNLRSFVQQCHQRDSISDCSLISADQISCHNQPARLLCCCSLLLRNSRQTVPTTQWNSAPNTSHDLPLPPLRSRQSAPYHSLPQPATMLLCHPNTASLLMLAGSKFQQLARLLAPPMRRDLVSPL